MPMDTTTNLKRRRDSGEGASFHHKEGPSDTSPQIQPPPQQAPLQLKILARVLANRLRLVISDLIGSEFNYAVKGRSIQDNLHLSPLLYVLALEPLLRGCLEWGVHLPVPFRWSDRPISILGAWFGPGLQLERNWSEVLAKVESRVVAWLLPLDPLPFVHTPSA